MGRQRSSVAALLVLTALVSGCIVAQSNAVPHANYKVAIPPGGSAESTLDAIATAVRSVGYRELPNQWQQFEGKVADDTLGPMLKERRFKKQRFEIDYRPLGAPEAPTSLRLSFYEFGAYVFSDAGIAEFGLLRARFSAAGLILLDETQEDRESSRPIDSPADFNATHHAPTATDRAPMWVSSAVALVAYGFVVLLPGMLLARKVVRAIRRSVPIRRGVFASLTAALFAPVPVMASMFGPFVLMPMVLGHTIIPTLPEEWTPLLLGSFSATFVVALIVSIAWVTDAPDAAPRPPVT